MAIINILMSILAAGIVLLEIRWILVSNKKIELVGKDDYFLFALLLAAAVCLCPVTLDGSIMAEIRSMLVFLALFGSLGVKRGLTSEGIIKFGYNISWSLVDTVKVEEYQMAKIKVTYSYGDKKASLLFHKYDLKKVLAVTEKYTDTIYIQPALEPMLKIK